MDYKNKEYHVEDNMERVSRLPEEYISAIETIVDNLDKDWQNKLVNPKYVAYLCDLFEEAVAQGKSVNEVVGDDVVAYARKFQSEVDFRDFEPTDYNKFSNTFLMGNLLYLFGFNFINPVIIAILEGQKVASFMYVLAVVGAGLVIGGFILKYPKVKQLHLSVLIPLLEIVFMAVICTVTGFEQLGILISVILLTIFDFVMLYRRFNR